MPVRECWRSFLGTEVIGRHGAEGAGSSTTVCAVAKRSWSRRVWLGALGGLVLFSGCSASTPKRDQLIDALTRSGLPKAVSSCVADSLVSDLDDAQLDLLVEYGAAGAPQDDPDRQDDAADRLREALAECRDELPTTTTTIDPDASTIPITPTTVGGTVGGARIDPGPTTTVGG